MGSSSYSVSWTIQDGSCTPVSGAPAGMPGTAWASYSIMVSGQSDFLHGGWPPRGRKQKAVARAGPELAECPFHLALLVNTSDEASPDVRGRQGDGAC